MAMFYLFLFTLKLNSIHTTQSVRTKFGMEISMTHKYTAINENVIDIDLVKAIAYNNTQCPVMKLARQLYDLSLLNAVNLFDALLHYYALSDADYNVKNRTVCIGTNTRAKTVARFR